MVAAAMVTVTLSVPATTVGLAGAAGAPRSLTVFNAAFVLEVPPLFVAVALTVYVAPPVRPVMSQEPDRPVTVHVPPAAPAVVVDAVTV